MGKLWMPRASGRRSSAVGTRGSPAESSRSGTRVVRRGWRSGGVAGASPPAGRGHRGVGSSLELLPRCEARGWRCPILSPPASRAQRRSGFVAGAARDPHRRPTCRQKVARHAIRSVIETDPLSLPQSVYSRRPLTPGRSAAAGAGERSCPRNSDHRSRQPRTEEYPMAQQKPKSREETILRTSRPARPGLRSGALPDHGRFSNFAISFSIISILTGAVILFDYGLAWAGPAASTIGWPLVSIFTLLIAASMANRLSVSDRRRSLLLVEPHENKDWAGGLRGSTSPARSPSSPASTSPRFVRQLGMSRHLATSIATDGRCLARRSGQLYHGRAPVIQLA